MCALFPEVLDMLAEHVQLDGALHARHRLKVELPDTLRIHGYAHALRRRVHTERRLEQVLVVCRGRRCERKAIANVNGQCAPLDTLASSRGQVYVNTISSIGCSWGPLRLFSKNLATDRANWFHFSTGEDFSSLHLFNSCVLRASRPGGSRAKTFAMFSSLLKSSWSGMICRNKIRDVERARDEHRATCLLLEARQEDLIVHVTKRRRQW